MITKSAKILSGLALAELGVFVFAANRFGVFGLLLVVAALSAVGVMYLVRLAPSLVRSSIDEGLSGQLVGDRALKIFGGFLLAFPGLLTGIVGALLFVSPVRSALRPLAASRLGKFVPSDLSESFGSLFGASRRRDVVDVTATTKPPSRDNAPTGTRPELP